MSIFDIFTFKKQAQEVFSKENINHILVTARDVIVSQAKANLPGPEKKESVDNVVIATIEAKTAHCTNGLVKLVVALIIKVVPQITQLIYNFLKEKIETL